MYQNIRKHTTRTAGAALAVIIMAAALVLAGAAGTAREAQAGSTPRIDENAPAGAGVGTPLRAQSDGSPARYSLSGPDAASFAIDPGTGEVSLAATVSPDFEARPNYSLTVTASADVTVLVANLDEPGAVSLSTGDPALGEPVTASLTDPDGGIANAEWSWARQVPGGWEDPAEPAAPPTPPPPRTSGAGSGRPSATTTPPARGGRQPPTPPTPCGTTRRPSPPTRHPGSSPTSSWNALLSRTERPPSSTGSPCHPRTATGWSSRRSSHCAIQNVF